MVTVCDICDRNAEVPKQLFLWPRNFVLGWNSCGKNSSGCWAFLASLAPFDLIEEATIAQRNKLNRCDKSLWMWNKVLPPLEINYSEETENFRIFSTPVGKRT